MNIDYRINYFKQIKDFYSLIFNTDYEVRPVHISLYMFLLNQNNRNNWVEWFKCPFDLAMAGACINSKNTYYKTLDDLQFFNLIEYEKGINLFKAPKIKILPIKEVSSVLNNDTLTEQVSVPQSEPLSVPQSEPLSVLLNKNTYKLITYNFETINLKQKEVNLFLESILPIKHEEGKRKKVPLKKEIELPFEFIEIWDLWLEYRVAKKITKYASDKFEQMAINKLLKYSNSNPIIAKKIIEESITNSWTGFFELKNNENQKPKNLIQTND